MTTLAEKVAFLCDPAAYPLPAQEVEARETHMSWVFLVGDRVYKLKKPLRYSHLDHGTLARRRHACEEELRLNRRLAPEVYLGVVPLCRSAGRLHLGGPGRVVDWLVEMVRLPEAEMLDVRIARGRLGPADLAAVGERLATFYLGLPREVGWGARYADRLAATLRLDRAVLSRPELGLAAGSAAVLDAAEAALAQALPEIRARAAAGALLEGHGDLRPEHICLTEPPQIFDCLEFDRLYRVLDAYDELAFLSVECAVLDADWVGRTVTERVAQRLGAAPSPALLDCYGALGAVTRARLCLAHLLEPPVRLPGKWRPLALRYLAVASDRLSPPAPPGRREARRS